MKVLTEILYFSIRHAGNRVRRDELWTAVFKWADTLPNAAAVRYYIADRGNPVKFLKNGLYREEVKKYVKRDGDFLYTVQAYEEKPKAKKPKPKTDNKKSKR